ncbi:msl5380 [Mesorhizobium japonicum MAFF 303099]|uniref:Msl5380 protein n=1 Tax=Mesorhizobium japonicum (strain LMG 29417 / CECT 9101 / MAFF 303099) TaxID=266835 RepID=Q98BY1_RHILO|nr:msl5380 [Mesorhizobium japonicum MAFF 303099]
MTSGMNSSSISHFGACPRNRSGCRQITRGLKNISVRPVDLMSLCWRLWSLKPKVLGKFRFRKFICQKVDIGFSDR